MAHDRLTAKPSVRNDISELTQCFVCSFEHHLQPSVPFYDDYLCALRTVVGLGFTAVLAHNSVLLNYQSHLKIFLNYDAGNFRNRIEAKTAIAQSIAEMVHLAIPCFRSLSYLRYPNYYPAFFNVLKYSLRGLLSTEHHQKASDFLDELRRKIH